jgi:hypothetical protein
MPDIDMVIGGSVDERLCSRVAVVLEPGRSGATALAHATALAATPACELTVVAIAPKATGCRCCGGPSPYAYDCAVRDDVAQELHKATARLGPVGQDIKVKLLVEGSDPPLETWIAQGRFDLVLLPARWRVLRSRSHPAARLLRRFTDANIRVVRAPGRQSGTPS